MPKKTIIACALYLLSLTSCYRMPTEDDYCVIPTTNNPSITRERNDSMMPNVGY